MYCIASNVLPLKTPVFVKKARNINKRRTEQVKNIRSDLKSIANKEIDRIHEMAKELLNNVPENPIVLHDNNAQDEE